MSRTIAATPAAIFAVLSDPSLHAVIDGSGTVQGAHSNERQLRLGSKFSMGMRMGVPYRISNEVVEFEQDRRIAWRLLGGHGWRYELRPVDGGTEVTETFDWSTSRAPKGIELAGYPRRHVPNMERTLERLEAFLSHRSNAL